MRGYRALVSALLKSQFREPVGFFFLVLFSPLLLIIMGLIFGNDPAPEFGGEGFIERTLPGIIVISVMITGVVVTPQQLLGFRTSGVFTRFRATPLQARTFIAADLTVQFVSGLVGAMLALALGLFAFGVAWPASFVGVILALAFGQIAMLAVGYALAVVYPSVGAATGIGNALMIVLMMTSGAFIPTAVLPSGVQAAMNFSPVYHIAELVRASWSGETWPLISTLVLVGVTAVFGAVGIALFRWDRLR